ncbi:Hypothetical protein SCLAV_2572 [Streptomyces clavuligerus]|uniref:Uncharacterized protein n=1 Tax=Streptomyces clavuligerus TaxID=1901 RepID=B5GY12_STRCL|nr:hypothetical protein SSCG_04292 [Streptomyces clavuligerus]EFG07644.1 Hypothetical protein SCLAV_2572 [Streptomyces clavuligerus]
MYRRIGGSTDFWINDRRMARRTDRGWRTDHSADGSGVDHPDGHPTAA